MREVEGREVKVSRDSTGGFISVDWDCPYCGEYNATFAFANNEGDILGGDFVLEQDCEECGKTVSIICKDAAELF